MSIQSSLTPEIHVRDRRFRRDAMGHRWWMNGDPIGTAFYNALSAGFPKGEAFFIDSVRFYRDSAPAELAADIAGFTKQELLHTREHVAFNRRVTEAGHDMSAIEAAVDDRIRKVKAKPPVVAVAAVAASEHITAMIAHEILINPRHLAKADPDAAAMWRWHAIDEIEHKAVAFDTFVHATKGWSRYTRWKLKSLAMLVVTRNLIVERVMLGTMGLLRQDGLGGWRVRLRVAWFLLGRPGLFRRVLPAWLAFFIPGFHPWNHDNRALIADTRASMPVDA
jgi:predicted metal-dependent hydrolase